MQAQFGSLEMDGAVQSLLTVNHGLKSEDLNNYLNHPTGQRNSDM